MAAALECVAEERATGDETLDRTLNTNEGWTDVPLTSIEAKEKPTNGNIPSLPVLPGRDPNNNLTKDRTADKSAPHSASRKSMQNSSYSENTSSQKATFSDSARPSTHVLSGSQSYLLQDEVFMINFRKAQEAIKAGKHPMLIPDGTSGSYFVQDVDGNYLAIFKPKDEEPFAPLNPKWPKFFQRILCFCCFGRACLIPNNGYVSEAAASLVDEKLRLDVVPRTRIVKLASPSFFYSRSPWHRMGAIDHWPKEGSYQLFVKGYESAGKVMDRWEYDPSLLSEDEASEFTILFQKMCVLDYVIRNTDRHKDNWLIRHVPGKEIKLAAIDNGLAFPVKHPESASRFRQFPFQWASLKWANEPWDENLRAGLLEKITPMYIHSLCKELRVLLRHDAYNRLLTNNQLRVLRGQVFNLLQALKLNMCPAEMARMKPILLSRRYKKVPQGNSIEDNFIIRDIDYTGQVCC